MVIIEDTIPVPHIKRTPSEKRMTVAQDKTLERYKAAYQRVYGIPPEVSFSHPWFTIMGHNDRVSRERLKEMAQQLEFRAGD